MNPNFDQLSRSFEEHGYVMTEKRKVVISYLFEQYEVLDIEDVWMNFRTQERVSLATVYTVVKLLNRTGWLEEYTDHSSKRSAYRWAREIKN